MAAIARQLQTLYVDSGDANGLASGLTALGVSLAVAVPSCVSVSVWVGAVGSDVLVVIGIRSGGVGPVLACLAVPRSLSEPRDLVLFQASEAGAFLLLADDLRGLLDPPLSLRIDEHLHIEIDATAGGLTRSLDDLSATHRTVGVLIDRGLLLEDAYVELSAGHSRTVQTLPAPAGFCWARSKGHRPPSEIDRSAGSRHPYRCWVDSRFGTRSAAAIAAF